MAIDQPVESDFRITHETKPSESLVAGFSSFGLAGLTAANYLTEQLEVTESGHITAERLPAITPFENGIPRHHTRLFSHATADVTVLTNELFVPPLAADSFSQAVLDWGDRNGVEEITVLAGVPVAHGPDEHRTYYVATDDYRAARLRDTELQPMGRGFLDGVNASLVGRGIDSDLRVGVLVTPVHAQAPDAEAALRLVDALEQVLGVSVETDELENLASEVERYYRELADRLERVDQEHVYEDRMFV